VRRTDSEVVEGDLRWIGNKARLWKSSSGLGTFRANVVVAAVHMVVRDGKSESGS
jgi:hypothetical protein